MFRMVPSTGNSFIRKGNDISDLFDEIFKESIFNDGAWPSGQLSEGSFKVDVKDKEDAYVFEADLPGYKKEEISLEYKDNKLLIRAEKEEDIEEEKDTYIRRERRSSKMERAFLMKDIRLEEMKAKLDNGVLTVIAPKVIEAEVEHRIAIE